MEGAAGLSIAVGILLLAAGLFGSVGIAHLRSIRYFDRPGFARRRGFDTIASVLRWLSLVAGLGLVARATRGAALGIAAVLGVLWSYRMAIRSLAFQTWLLRRDHRALRSARPGAPEREVLRELLLRRNPRWGEELIDQMVLDYPDIESLARMVAKMERGFRGFR